MQNENVHPLHNLFREPVNGLTHAAGALLSVAGLAVLVTLAAADGKTLHVVAFSVYGASLILLYTASALYHLLRVQEKTVALLRRIDHMMIYMLIAGTYTPVCLIALQGTWGRTMLILIWSLAAAGILFTTFWMNAPRWLYTALYLVMGWSAVAAIFPLFQSLPSEGLIWLLAGGIFYTAGAIMYAMKKPNLIPGWLGFHEIWHLFVIAGSASHYMMMFQSLLPMAG